MKKIPLLIIPCIAALLVNSSWAMGERQKQDPACFAGDKLRFQLGQHKLNIPRKNISGFTCPDPAFEHDCTVSNRKICQRTEDASLNISRVHFYLNNDVPSLPNGPKCNPSISVTINVLNNFTEQKKIESKNELLQRMTKECAEKKYFNDCPHDLRYGDLWAHIQYDSRCYPPEKTDEVLDVFEKTLKQYESDSE